ncbi:methionine--tRNA ligase [Vibrio aquimaris]|uniref:Methionine--tRNA ligase n=1 Tax=Vibrio aquimaris TaxID=2587862 RepID=A0A5P9CIC1_9VIBR|nr:methionine--tRNA ligase [Vibrio aquimaris]QFT25791.1 Methionine--tRNA ligase [Vibrio aquimaris]
MNTNNSFNLNLSKSSKTEFITTPIFYANGEPHLGHAYTGIIADIFCRYERLAQIDIGCKLITGTDEHGQKIASAAQSNNLPAQDFVDTLSQSFQDLWPKLAIEQDAFIRTTDRQHKLNIQRIWQQLEQQGDIYLGHYSGHYCIACEQFYPEKSLLDGACCPVHKREVIFSQEETYLFRLEKYREALIEYYQSNDNCIEPSHYQQSLIEQLKSSPLDDLSVSRINNKWGIQVPNNQGHTVYVWIDALFSYLSAIQNCGGNTHSLAHTQHVIGKDILLFHAVYWPAFLLALDIKLPQKLIVHGWWTIGGEKVSKSNPHTTVNPSLFSERLTCDGLRYALLRHKPLHRDGNLVLDEFAQTINADLLNNLANLVKRNHTLITKNFAGEIKLAEISQLDKGNLACINKVIPVLENIINAYQTRDLHRVAKEVNWILTELNGFFHQRAPWLVNKEQPEAKAKQTCLVVSNLVRELVWLLSPITPTLCQTIIEEKGTPSSSLFEHQALILKDAVALCAKSHWQKI